MASSCAGRDGGARGIQEDFSEVMMPGLCLKGQVLQEGKGIRKTEYFRVVEQHV